MLVEFFEEVVKGFQSYQNKEGGGGSEDVHSSSACQTDGRCDPKAGGSGQAAYHILTFMEDNGTCTDETNTRLFLSGHT